MINTCCNLYFYYNFIVHGGIRHLEIHAPGGKKDGLVHGGIRHLENFRNITIKVIFVHGGIRHLEMSTSSIQTTL